MLTCPLRQMAKYGKSPSVGKLTGFDWLRYLVLLRDDDLSFHVRMDRAMEIELAGNGKGN